MSVASCTSSSSGSRPSSPEDDDSIYVSAQIAKFSSLTNTSDTDTLFSSINGMQRPDQIALTYFIWSEHRKLIGSNTDMSTNEISRNLSNRWKCMDYRDRLPFYLEYQNFKKQSVERPNSFKCRNLFPDQHSVTSTNVANFKKPDLPYSKTTKEHRTLIFKGQSSEVNVSASVAAALGLSEQAPKPNVSQLAMPMETSKVTVTPGTKFVPKVSHQMECKTGSVFDKSNNFDAPEMYFSSAKEALDSYYMALCEPAFPSPGDQPLIAYDANFCYEAFMKISSTNQPLL